MNSYTGTLEARLRERRSEGRKLLVPYVTGGYPVDGWTTLIEGFAAAGADALEIGIPFSDPMIDGPTIQQASAIALEHGSNPGWVAEQVGRTDPGIPLVAMTYYNVAYRMGHERFASTLKGAGICGTILPDLPLEESDEWRRTAEANGIETILLAAPTAPDDRLPKICEASRGFVYGVGLVGITGERAELAQSALEMARRLKETTDLPVIIGIGVSNPEQAAEICQIADGVVVASAIIRRMLSGGSLEDAVGFVGELRAAIDAI